MGIRLNVITLLSSFAFFACGGSTSQGEAKGPEKDLWAGYKGTYATAAGASGSPSARLKAAKTEAAQTDAPKEAPVEVADETPAPAPVATPAPAKKAKSGAGKAPAKKKK